MKTHPTNVTSTPTRTAPPPAKSNVTRNSTTATKPGSTSTKSAAKPTRPSTGAAQPAKPMAVSANKAAANSTKSAPAPAGSKPPASSSKTSSSTTNTALPSSNKSAAAKPATPRPATQSTKTAAKTTAKPSAAANKTTTKSTSATTPARTTPRPTSTSPPPTTAPPTTPTPTTAKPVLEPSALEKTEAQRNRTAQLVAAIRAAVGLPAKSVSSSSTKLAANAVDAALPHKVLHKAPAGASTPSATTTPSPGGTLPTSTGAPLREDGNATDCGVRCGDGSCVAAVSRCNQLVDCQDGADERGCTCADYLRAKFMHRKLCDGVVDCWDYSDESNCDWCEPGRYVCTSSRVCVETSRLCDGQRDCPYGDDERQCVSVAPDVRAADDLVYHSEGLVMVRRQGVWGKLCAKGIVGQGPQPTAASAAVPLWGPLQLGEVICRALTFSGVETARLAADDDPGHDVAPYFETGSNITDEKRQQVFVESECPEKQVLRVSCQSLLCGERPQATSHWARTSPADGVPRDAGRRARIVGGTNSGPGAWPWQAALYKEGEFQCGATLISDRWLLSAGHCFYHALDDYWVARLGALRRGTDFASPYEQLRPLSAIVLHPGYVDAGFINDISLLRMRDPVLFSDYIRPVCLPPPSAILKDGTMCTVVGWGQLFEVGRVFPDTLQEVQLPTISTAECRRRTLFLPLYRVTDNMFCAGFDRGGRDACLGDSGGPLMCQESDGRWTLHGVTSNGYGCARADRPGVYTKVVNYVRWVQMVMGGRQEAADRDGGGAAADHRDGELGLVQHHVSHHVSQQVAQALRDAKTACNGHRCPLGQCLPANRVCNGFIECSDGSDEKGCW